ncbi:LysE family transporter [uncultured Bifidobacterium sp.]|uniref:LysE/ArgO family amino acid transporter n=1 Tax=uncultured Bifidobacterium sp. TaxID=165187 RepID=UPI002613F23A|nr:LysE family transporter [uncultured Bifidobacterium sp.]
MDPIIILPLAQGLGMGLAYVAPIGVENMYLANSALRQSRRRAVVAMVIVLLFDLSLSASAFWGMGVILERHNGLDAAVRLLGGLLVIGMGAALAFSSLRSSRDTVSRRHVHDEARTSRGAATTAQPRPRLLGSAGRSWSMLSSAWAIRHPRVSWMASTIATAFAITWCNPQAIIDGTLMLGAFRSTLSASQAPVFLLGIMLASCLWFSLLTLSMMLVGDHINGTVTTILNTACAVVMMAYGLHLIVQFLQMMTLR